MGQRGLENMNRPSLGRRGRVCGGTWERVARLVGENEEKWNMCGAIEVARAWGLSVSRESEPLVSLAKLALEAGTTSDAKQQKLLVTVLQQCQAWCYSQHSLLFADR